MIMRGLGSVIRRELVGTFGTPVAYVVLFVFLVLNSALTFRLGGFFERGQADLTVFFEWHPWLYLLLVPAIAMRLWAEERRHGTIEILLTLPLSTSTLVVGKFLAGWLFLAVALLLTTPIWGTVSLLGEPDHGVILASYVASLLMGGCYLAMSAALSAITHNQIVAFVMAAAACFLFTAAGSPLVLSGLGNAPQGILDTIALLGTLGHFQAIQRGLLDARDVVYFISMMGFFLIINTALVERIRE